MDIFSLKPQPLRPEVARRNLDRFIEKHQIESYEELCYWRNQLCGDVLVVGCCSRIHTPYAQLQVRFSKPKRRRPWWMERHLKRKQAKKAHVVNVRL